MRVYRWCKTAFALALAVLLSTALRAEESDLEIVIAVDASTSVDLAEYALQLRGIAAAFRDGDVQAAIKNGHHGRIDVNVLVWAQPGFAKQLTGWHAISTPREAEAFAQKVEKLPRRQFGGTGMGEGVETALSEIEGNSIEAARAVIDVSGDGRETWFAVATQMPVVRRVALKKGVTINGLAILDEDPSLFEYYDTDVRTGAGSFVIAANNLADFAEAMRVKLLREIQGQSVALR